MTDGDARIPAGWYPDPLGLPQLRWWDNHSWTEYTSDAREPMVAQETLAQQTRLADSASASAAASGGVDEDLTRRERREREGQGDAGAAPSTAAPATATAGGGSGDGSGGDLPGTRFADPADHSDVAGRADSVTAESIEDLVPPPPSEEQLRAFEAPARDEQVISEEDVSPAIKFAEFVPSNAPTTPAFDLDSRFDDLLGDENEGASSAGVSAFRHVSGASSSFVPAFGESAAAAESESDRAYGRARADAPASRVAVSTGPVWVIALLPIAQLVGAMFFLLAQPGVATATPFGVALFAVPYVVSILLAWADHRALRARGLPHPAHWAFAFATAPVYLVARLVATIRGTGHGFAPLGTWLGTAIAVIATVIAVPGLVIALQPTAFSTQAEQSLEQKASALGADITVDCPAQVPTIVGSDFVCIAQRNDGIKWGVTVALARSNGWIDWRVDDWGIFTVANAAG